MAAINDSKLGERPIQQPGSRKVLLKALILSLDDWSRAQKLRIGKDWVKDEAGHELPYVPINLLKLDGTYTQKCEWLWDWLLRVVPSAVNVILLAHSWPGDKSAKKATSGDWWASRPSSHGRLHFDLEDNRAPYAPTV
jgi:hypothetical protein